MLRSWSSRMLRSWMLGEAKEQRIYGAEVLRYLWSKGALGAKELRKRGAWNS